MNLIANVFRKLRTRKNLVRYMAKLSTFRGTFDRQHGKRPQILLQSETPPLSYLVIILKVIELEKVSLSDMKNLINVC